MKEKGFSIYDRKNKVRIEGGNLWQAKKRSSGDSVAQTGSDGKTLEFYLLPSDGLNELREALYEFVRAKSWFRYTLFTISRRLPSILFIFPAMVTVFVFAFLTVWGDLVIDWMFMNPDEGTIIGLSRRLSLAIYGVIAVFILGFFPVFFTGDHDSVAQAIGERFSNRRLVKRRFKNILDFLKRRGYLERIVLWNPPVGENEKDWVLRSLMPAIIESDLELVMQIKIDERNLAQQYVEKVSKKEGLLWEESYFDYPADKIKAISQDYLEGWEKRLLAIYVFASTANTPENWQKLSGNAADGVLRNAVSLRLADLIIERFKERLFSEVDRKQLISTDAFASRCVNDFGILTPCLQYTNDVWEIAAEVVAQELDAIQNEMRYVYSYLQINIEDLSQKLEDPAAALVLNGVHQHASIYNHDRLEAIRFFVLVIKKTEQYKILKQYWQLVITNPGADENLNEDVYRILGVSLLIDLATIFERAGMYEHAQEASQYIELVYPYRGKVNKARIAERQGRFGASVEAMLEIKKASELGEIQLSAESNVDLCLNISWAIVSGRLKEYQQMGRDLLAQSEGLLYADFDKIRSSEQIIRMHNVLANYEEWEGRPEGAIANYDKALQIPGVPQAQLSNLFVNKGIALRQVGRLREAVIYGRQGAEIKLAIGDADQAPIALHNLAQTILLCAVEEQNSAEQIKLFGEATRYAQIGLDIQDRTGSAKKRGQLLVERLIGQYLAKNISMEIIQQSWAAAQSWIKVEIAENRADTYDCKVVAQELMSLLTGNKQAALQDVLAWNPTAAAKKD